ncbi:MAG: Hsp20/alpha crystallin family protein [Acidobacteriota bacterium]
MADVAFSRWDPLHDLLTLHERLNRLHVEDPPGWTPAVDLYETVDRYVISAELPGLSREAISIELHDHTLLIRGERQVAEVCGVRFHRLERGHGKFVRTFTLPQSAGADGITAEYGDGVLTILVPKARPEPRRVEVS